MLSEYRQHGLSFRYPHMWELAEETRGLQRTITLQTSGASFWTVTLFADRPAPEEILDSVLQTFQDEYDEVDVYPAQASYRDQPAAAADLDFVYLDTVTSVSLHAFETEDVSVLVLWQGTDRELEHFRDQFTAVTASLEFNDEAAPESLTD